VLGRLRIERDRARGCTAPDVESDPVGIVRAVSRHRAPELAGEWATGSSHYRLSRLEQCDRDTHERVTVDEVRCSIDWVDHPNQLIIDLSLCVKLADDRDARGRTVQCGTNRFFGSVVNGGYEFVPRRFADALDAEIATAASPFRDDRHAGTYGILGGSEGRHRVLLFHQFSFVPFPILFSPAWRDPALAVAT